MIAPGVKPDRAMIRTAIGVLFRAGDVVELRIPKAHRRGTISGYFDSPEYLAYAAADLDGAGQAIYVTLNPVNPTLLARSVNRTKDGVRETTSGKDISRRAWLLVDCDAVRPAG